MSLRHYRAGTGEPLVLLHGIGSRWQMWEPVIDRLVAHREVIALDLPGFGASPMPPPGTAAGVDSLVSLVAESLRELGMQRPHVAGNSLGGLIALELAKRRLVRSVNVISPVGFASRRERLVSRTSLWLSVRAARWVAPRADAIMAPRAGRQLGLGLFIAHPSQISPREAADSVRALAAAPWFDETLRATVPARFGGGQSIGVPVTIVWGAKDRLLPPQQALRAAAAIPDARLVILPDCGHLPTYDNPEAVARVLLEASGN